MMIRRSRRIVFPFRRSERGFNLTPCGQKEAGFGAVIRKIGVGRSSSNDSSQSGYVWQVLAQLSRKLRTAHKRSRSMGALTFGRGLCILEVRSRRELTDAIARSLSVVSDNPIATLEESFAWRSVSRSSA